MSLKLLPDYIFEKFNNVTADFLVSLNVKGVILDIDNTLEPYEIPLPEEHVLRWFSELSEKGILCAFVSNNDRERVELFNKELGFPAYHKAAKPFKKNVLKAMADLGTDRATTLLIGDQILTDVWAAHNAKIKAVLVKPIKDKRDLFTRFKRLLERPLIKKYYKRSKK